MQHYIFADDLSQRTLVEKEVGEHIQVVERPVLGIRPVEREFVAAVRIVGKIACIHAVRYYEQLNIVEQPMKRRLVITLDLIVCLLQFHAAFLQLDLHQRKTVDENRDVVAALPMALNGYLIGNLKLVLTPLFLIEKLHPNTLAIFCFQRIEVS